MSKSKPKTTPEKTSTRSRLTTAEIAEAVALYESGSTTLEELGRRFDKRPETFMRLFKKMGVVKGSKAAETTERVREEVEKSMLDDAALLASRIRETKEEHYKMATALGKLSWNEIFTAKKEGRTYASTMNELKAIGQALANLKMAREERYIVLGINDDGGDDPVIPELPIHELTQDQIEEMRAKAGDDELDLDALDDGVEDLT